MYAVTVLAPEGTIVNARMPAAVAGGNVEASQRIVEVLLRAPGQGGSGKSASCELWQHEQSHHGRFLITEQAGLSRITRRPPDVWALVPDSTESQVFTAT